MTSSRIRFAGMNPLLAGLFKDDESESSGGLGLFPGVRIESESRGRGYGLTMKPQQRDPQKVTVEAPTLGKAKSMLGDVNITNTNTNTNTNTLPEVEEPEMIDPGKAFADQYLQNFSKYDQGEQGLFGGKDVDFLRGKGVADEDIRRIADERSTVQQLPAAVYQRLGGVTPAEQSTSGGGSGKVGAQAYAQNYTSGKSGFDAGAAGIFGGQDVDAMRQKGYSDNEIRATVNAVRNTGQSIPDAVFRRLGNF
mgnify:CR=1 FL=1